jgi:hypothetical protein
MDTEKGFKVRFVRSVFTRFHMTLILLGTVLSGLLFSKLFLTIGIHKMFLRYPIVVVCSYSCFFLFMKLWLTYLTYPYRKGRNHGSSDVIDALVQLPDSAGSSRVSTPSFTPGGGEFGGAGASATFEQSSVITALPADGLAGASEGVAESMADGVGGTAAEGVGDAVADSADDGVLILVLLGILLLAVLGTGMYLIYEAPTIFSEAAFQFVLAAGMVKKSNKMDTPDWVGSVFRSTWKPFLFTLIAACALAWVATSFCPQAMKLSEVVKKCL